MSAAGVMEAGTPTRARVAYQGAPGAFSHEACLALRPWDEAVGFETFAQAIAAVRSGDCGCGLIPVENTTVGAVEPAATLVRDSGLEVVTEVWRPIRLALLGLPDARLEGVRTALSHPIALSQCAQTLAARGVRPVEAFDTAGAARQVAEGGDPGQAAVASAAAAEAYGLQVLLQDLSDQADNRTRFVLLCAPGEAAEA